MEHPMYRFARLPDRANDRTRRYQVIRFELVVGRVELTGDHLLGEPVAMGLNCRPVLSDAEREDAMNHARRFLDELAGQWGAIGAAVMDPAGWSEQPDGTFQCRLVLD